MTSWLPELAGIHGPRYLAIAEALEGDIAAGRLAPGTRLPTHRNLAESLGVTVGTVSRAYAEAIRRGLVSGEVGRGSFVRGEESVLSPDAPGPGDDASLIDLSMNYPMSGEEEQKLATTLSMLAARKRLAGLLEYKPHGGTSRHRAAGASWLGRAGIDAPADQVLVCAGAQHAMAVVFTALTRPGDTVLTEALTYPGMKALAEILHLKMKGLPLDDQGLVPEALEAACREGTAKILYCIPTIQNPTATVMPETRRKQIAAIAKRHGLIIVEDDTYGLLPVKRPPPIAAFAPESSFFLTGLSKTLAPGLRIGYVLSPKKLLDRAVAGIRSTVWMAAPLMAEIAATWIEEGTADQLLARKRVEAVERQRLARGILDGQRADADPHSYHLWLHLPEPWSSDGFAQRARQRGVAVTPASAFAVGETDIPAAVRVCLGATKSRAQLERGLRLLDGALAGSPHPDLSIV